MVGELTNFILILDGTESMLCNEFRRNRFWVALQGIKIFLREKEIYSPNAFYSLLIAGKQTLVLSSLSKTTKKITDQLQAHKFKKNFCLEGSNSDIIYTLDLAFEMIDQQIQRIGGHASEIIIISSEFDTRKSQKLEELVQKAQLLNIKFSILILNTNLDSSLFSHYKEIAEKTHGTLQVFQSKKNFLEKIKDFAHTTIEASHVIKLTHPKEKSKEDHLIEIAKALRRPTSEEIRKINDRFSDLTCKICFSQSSTMLHSSTKRTLRFCPACDTPLHLYCATMWSIQTQEKGNMIRCPYCYNLLKIPTILRRGLKIQKKLDQKNKTQPHFVKMIRFKNDPSKKENVNIFWECCYCFEDIPTNLENNDLYSCSKCSALFHKHCLQKIYKKNKKCPNCHGELVI
jgi:hypothetical protein